MSLRDQQNVSHWCKHDSSDARYFVVQRGVGLSLVVPEQTCVYLTTIDTRMQPTCVYVTATQSGTKRALIVPDHHNIQNVNLSVYT